MVGGNCLRLFKGLGWKVVGSHRTFPTEDTVYFDTLSLSSEENFDLAAFAPDAIIHCGALTHVDYCESHEEESYEKNVKATENLLAIAEKCKSKFVFLSTDYVFDGKNGPYREDAPTNPLSVYGKHKLEAEKLIQERLGQYLILRVTNVYGKEQRNKNFVARIIQQCIEDKKLTLQLPVDQFANPTNAFDIARAIATLLEADKNGIYHIGGTDYMNRSSLALRILQYFPNASFSFEPKTTEQLQQAAKRPLSGGFISSKFLSEFPAFQFSSVDQYLSGIVSSSSHFR